MKQQVNAYLTQKELDLLNKAKNTDGKSVREVLMIGIYHIIGLDIKKDT